MLRIVAIGYRNWLFAKSDLDTGRAVIIYSLIANCKLSEIDPFEYLPGGLNRISIRPFSKIAESNPSGRKRHLIARN